MFLNYKLMFSFMLMLGSIISISSNSWMGMWLGLEINLLAFIPLIQEKNNTFSIESSLKYFLTQTLASMILLFTLITLSCLFMTINDMNYTMMMIFNTALLTKMGMAPFHFWFPEVMEGLKWKNCFILLSMQKMAPMIMIMYNFNYNYYFLFIIVLNLLISGVMGLNQTSLRKILAYSSINHMTWMLNSMLFESIWLIYFIIYTLISFNIIILFKIFNIFYFNQLYMIPSNIPLLKIMMSVNLLSLGGLPPLLGFFPKWITLQYMIFSKEFFIMFLMLIGTLFTLFYYLRIIYNIFIYPTEINYQNMISMKNWIILTTNFISTMSLMFCTIMFNFT